MALIRRVATVSLLLAGLTGTLADARPIELPLAVTPVADVGWPPSASLLVAEVVTGGASASDEWIELANVAVVPADLGGLELVYASASGATVTRKASWPSGATLGPGARLLLANAAGIHAGIADATYSGGLASTGGAVAIRPVGGEPIDAVGWGDAVNAFVEGAPAPATPAGSSIARLTIGGGGLVDTNDNAADLFVDPAPVPEGLGSGPSPSPSPSPSPDPSPSPSPTPSAEPSAEPSPSPDASPSPIPSPSFAPSPSPSFAPSPEPSVDPTPTPTPEPSPSPTPEPTAEPSAEPSASPTPDLTAIGDARALPLGASATLEGVLTTALGALESGRGAFIQDETGGIAVYLDAAALNGLAPGERIRVAGTTAERYGQRTLRAAEAAIVALGPALFPVPVAVATGQMGEALEGRLITSGGWVVDGPDPLSDGQAVTLDDGTGPMRVVIAEALIDSPLATGEWLDVVGPLGQRDSSGTGTAGYRMHVTRSGDLARSVVEPSPSPDATPSPSATPGPSASPEPSATPAPSPSPSAGPGPTPILVARGLPVGSVVRVRGVVTAEPGRVEKPPLVPIDDGTAGIIVRLPDGATVVRGTILEVVGRLADPYGQLEVRVADVTGLADLGSALEPHPTVVGGADLGESLEARAVSLDGRLLRSDRTTAGTTTADLEDVDGAVFRVMIHPSTGIERTSLVKGSTYRLVGIVGQRASRSGALDGYRVWLRDGADLELLAPAATSSPSPAPSPGASPDPGSIQPIAIAAALARAEGPATIEGVVTVPSRLLDATGRRIVLEDASGAVEVLLPAPADPTVGTRLRVGGTLGIAYGAPRLRAATVESLGRSALPVPATLSGTPTARLEWRLARATGTLVEVERLGDRWRGELRLANGAIVPLAGLAGAGIDAAGLREEAAATVVGIVRRPYPSATDQRFALVPRSSGDLRLAPAGPAASAERAGAPGTADGRAASATTDQASGAPLVDLARLAEHLGRTVRVGGLVVAVSGTTLELDDGTALGRLVLVGAAAPAASALRPGDALTATGRVEGDPDDPEVVVDDAATIVLAGDPVAAGAAGGPVLPPADVGAVLPAAGLEPSAASTVEAPLAPLALLAVVAVAAAGGLAAVRHRSSSRRRTAVLADRLRRVVGPGVVPQTPSVAPARATLAAERGDSA